jgi:glycine betaine/proline transport system substrate-binding protein
MRMIGREKSPLTSDPPGRCTRAPYRPFKYPFNRIGATRRATFTLAWMMLAMGAALMLALGRPTAAASVPDGATETAASAEPPSCQNVRLSDIGWTDVTAMTALTAALLEQQGYKPSITVLSVPVTYASMKHRDIDVFMGNWMPSQEGDRKTYLDDGSIEVLGPNLTGAKYTLAVPAYTYEAGLRDFADIGKFAAALGHTIYGIEPGNDGNRHVLEMIHGNLFGVGNFKLLESSEQGMLAEVERAVHAQRPIVFLGWAPHPMNLRFDMRYLNGGDAVFGPNFGGAIIYTNIRAGYAAQCPNVVKLLRNLKFNLDLESQLMSAILDQHRDPREAALSWLGAHAEVRAQWLQGVASFGGGATAAAGVSLTSGAAHGWLDRLELAIVQHKIPVGDSMDVFITTVKAHGGAVFNGISAVVHAGVDGLTRLLEAVPGPVLIVVIGAVIWFWRRSFALAAFVTLALLFIMNQGYWVATLETLSLVAFAAAASTLIGVPIGIAAAHRPWLYALIRPVLDLMQTLPTFVYLIPTLVLFGLGVVPGLISTVIFALPAPIRLTHLGVASVPNALLEAGQAFGATRSQLLWKIELPAAAPSILTGITQCIMLSLSMVVIAALVGAGGLGVPVVRALNTVQIGMGFEAGIAIVLLAVILDRVTRPPQRHGQR